MQIDKEIKKRIKEILEHKAEVQEESGINIINWSTEELLSLISKIVAELELKKDGNQEHDFWAEYFNNEQREKLKQLLGNTTD